MNRSQFNPYLAPDSRKPRYPHPQRQGFWSRCVFWKVARGLEVQKVSSAATSYYLMITRFFRQACRGHYWERRLPGCQRKHLLGSGGEWVGAVIDQN